MLCSNPLEVRLELSSVVRHSLGLLGVRHLWCQGKLTVPQSDGFKQLLMLQLSVSDGHRVMGQVEGTGHREHGGIHVKAVLVSHILDLTPLVVGVEVGVAASHHSSLVPFGLDVAVWLGSGQSGSSIGKLKTETILVNYLALINLEGPGRRGGRGIREREAV